LRMRGEPCGKKKRSKRDGKGLPKHASISARRLKKKSLGGLDGSNVLYKIGTGSLPFVFKGHGCPFGEIGVKDFPAMGKNASKEKPGARSFKAKRWNAMTKWLESPVGKGGLKERFVKSHLGKNVSYTQVRESGAMKKRGIREALRKK